MTSRSLFGVLAGGLLVASSASVAVTQRAAATTAKPGPQGGGVTLLPNGWRIAPAGRHLSVGDLPLAMVESPDGRFLIVSNDGYAKASLAVIDVARMVVKSHVTVDDAWLGLAFHPDGTRVFSSGAGDNSVHELAWDNGVLTKTTRHVL